MAVPKKKLSVSRRKIRLNSRKKALGFYTQCDKCLSFIPLHRKCTCESNKSTNLINKYNLDFL